MKYNLISGLGLLPLFLVSIMNFQQRLGVFAVPMTLWAFVRQIIVDPRNNNRVGIIWGRSFLALRSQKTR